MAEYSSYVLCVEEVESIGKQANQVQLHPRLQTYVEGVVKGFGTIAEERKRELRKLALLIRAKQASNEPANLTFICTHNSRRSHMGQLWATTAAAWFGIDSVGTFSGGTETTAFNPRAVAALARAGFVLETPGGDNPRYRVTYGPDGPVMQCFSKKYDDPCNPKEGFAAVMTCSEADRSCPVVLGSALRVAIPYEDPKAADGTPEEAQRYDERCRQIATEMFYLLSQVNA
jgi:arsenate reductase